jgi:hypothetical protein
MKIKYGFDTRIKGENKAVISDSKDWAPVVAEFMKGVEHTSYECDYKIRYGMLGDECIIVKYNTDELEYPRDLWITRVTLLDIDGVYHYLPLWPFNDKAVAV